MQQPENNSNSSNSTSKNGDSTQQQQKTSVLISSDSSNPHQPTFQYKQLTNEDNYLIEDDDEDGEHNTTVINKHSKPESTDIKQQTEMSKVTAIKTADNIFVEQSSEKEKRNDSQHIGSSSNNSNPSKSAGNLTQSSHQDNNNFQSEYELKFDNIIPDLNDKQEYVVRMESSITCTSF